MSVRITPDMKGRLEEIATYNGRSQSQEAEFRLERSFAREDLLPEVLRLALGELGGIVLLMALAMVRSGRLTAWNVTHDHKTAWWGDAWLSVPQAYDAAMVAAMHVLEAARPAGKVEPYEPPLEEVAETFSVYLKMPPAEAPRYAADIRRILNSATAKRMRAYNEQAFRARAGARGEEENQ